MDRPAARSATCRWRPPTPSKRQTGKGLVGDRYTGGSGKRGVTLIQAEHLPVIAALSGHESVSPALLRRNVVVSGIPLIALKGRRFRIGDVVLEGTDSCDPCSRMEEALGPGGFNAMRAHGRPVRAHRGRRDIPRRRHGVGDRRQGRLMRGHCILSHGFESGPDATKVTALADVAERYGWTHERPDFTDLDAKREVSDLGDVAARVQRLLRIAQRGRGERADRARRIQSRCVDLGPRVVAGAGRGPVPDGAADQLARSASLRCRRRADCDHPRLGRRAHSRGRCRRVGAVASRDRC